LLLGIAALIAVLLGTGLIGGSSPKSAIPADLAGDIAGACNADARTIETAIGAYDADPPVSGLQSIGYESGITIGKPSSYSQGIMAQALLTSTTSGISAWPGNQYYAMALATAKPGYPGQVIVFAPPTSTQGVVYDSETHTTGCNAL
jgi:hypothetical protein